MISKELLSEILGYGVTTVRITSGEIIVYDGTILCDGQEWNEVLNIYELVQKCKLWIIQNGYGLSVNYVIDILTKEFTHFECLLYRSNVYTTDYFDMDSEDEIQAILKACEWVLNKGKK